MAIPMSFEQRSDLRHMHTSMEKTGGERGYSASMLVEESRFLQVSVFRTLQSNLVRIDFSLVLSDVMTIADEIDSQLSQAMMTYANGVPVN